jgi:hypothetical protein
MASQYVILPKNNVLLILLSLEKRLSVLTIFFQKCARTQRNFSFIFQLRYFNWSFSRQDISIHIKAKMKKTKIDIKEWWNLRWKHIPILTWLTLYTFLTLMIWIRWSSLTFYIPSIAILIFFNLLAYHKKSFKLSAADASFTKNKSTDYLI